MVVPIQFMANFEGIHSISEISRWHWYALKQRALSVRPISYVSHYQIIPDVHIQTQAVDTRQQAGITLLFNDMFSFARLSDAQRAYYTRNDYVVGFMVWETPQLPAEWQASLSIVDEIWTPSPYSQAIFSRYSDVPVQCIPHPVIVPEGSLAQRSRWGIPEEAVVFFYAFNANSSFIRKHPFGFLDAFERAFGRHHPKAVCVLKITHDGNRALRDALVQRVQALGGILIEEAMSRQDLFNLIASCDVIVSPHRAEGFGMLLAEAMALGKPVIATGYSGNLSFMNSDNSLLIPYELRPLKAEDYRLSDGSQLPQDYPLGSLWAEPDLSAIAQAMRQLFEDAELRQRLGERARQHITQHFSLDAIGAQMEARLKTIEYEVNWQAIRYQRQRLNLSSRPSAFAQADAVLDSSSRPKPIGHHQQRQKDSTMYSNQRPSHWQTSDGINLFGYSDTSGSFGIITEQMEMLLRAQGIPIQRFDHIHDVTKHTPPEVGRYALNLWFYPQHSITQYLDRLPELLAGRYSIAYLVYEMLPLSLLHRRAMLYFDEIWTPSRFSADLLALYTDKPITVIPHPITVKPHPAQRQRFGLPEHRWMVLISFHALSVEQRKNSRGALRAFQQTFAHLAPEQRPLIVLKTQRLAELEPALYQQLQGQVTELGGKLIDETLTHEDMLELMNCADVYLSLHRAEGFGIPLAEAMGLGKLVIATGYSGNLHFMNADNSYLVNYRLIQEKLETDETVLWAEADESHAAYLLRYAYEHPEEARALAERAQASIQRQLAPQRIAELAQQRLQTLDFGKVPSALAFFHASEAEVQTRLKNESWAKYVQQEMHHWIETVFTSSRLSQTHPIIKRHKLLGLISDTLRYISKLGKIFSHQAELYKRLTQTILQGQYQTELTKHRLDQLERPPTPAPARLETYHSLVADVPLSPNTELGYTLATIGITWQPVDEQHPLIQSSVELQAWQEQALNYDHVVQVRLIHVLEDYAPEEMRTILQSLWKRLPLDAEIIIIGYNPSYRYIAEVLYGRAKQAVAPAFIQAICLTPHTHLSYFLPHPAAQGDVTWADYTRYSLILRKDAE